MFADRNPKNRQTFLCRCITAALLAISASEAAQAYEEFRVNTADGRPFLSFLVLAPDEPSSIDDPDGGYGGERLLRDNEKQAILRGTDYLAALLKDSLHNTAPVRIELLPLNGLDGFGSAALAEADSPEADQFGTVAAAFLENVFRDNSLATQGFYLLWEPSEGDVDWNDGPLTPLYQDNKQTGLASVTLHEFTHLLGVGAYVEPTGNWHEFEGTYPYEESVLVAPNLNWVAGLRDIYGHEAKPGMVVLPVGADAPTDGKDVFWIGPNWSWNSDNAAIDHFDGTYFTGENVQAVLDGAMIQFPDGNPSAVPGIPVNGWEADWNEEEAGYFFPELSHIELQNSLLSHQNWRNWGTMMEAEIAVLQDLGYEIDRKDWFGHSVYNSGESAEQPYVYINRTPFYARNENGDGWLAGIPNTNPWGIGLHVYGQHTDVTQAADILTTGDYAIGVRVDGSGSTLRIAPSTHVRSDGEAGTGILVSYGKDHHVVSQGVVTALGNSGIAARFDFGYNMLGEGYEDRGSYRHWVYNDGGGDAKRDPARIGLDGALIDAFDLSGTLAGGKAAIFIGETAFVRAINVMAGARLEGDIVSEWIPSSALLTLPEESDFNAYVTEITFGLAANDVGEATSTAQSDFSLSYSGDIYGRTDSSTETGRLTAAVRLRVAGGTLEYNGTADVLNVAVAKDAVLSGNGTFRLSSLSAVSETAAEARTLSDEETLSGGDFRNEGIVSPGTAADPVGRISIEGTYIEGETGALLLSFSADGKTDQLEASSAASTSGDKLDTLRAQFEAAPDYYADGSLTVDFSNAVTIGEETISLTGTDLLSTASPTLSLSGTFDASSGTLSVTASREANAYSRHAAERHLRAVALAFDRHADEASGGMTKLIAALDFSAADGSTLPSAYQALLPDVFDRAGAASVYAASRTSDALVFGRLAAGASPAGETSPDAKRVFIMPLGGRYRDDDAAKTTMAGVLFGADARTTLDAGSLTAGGHAAFLKRRDDFSGAHGSRLDAEAFYAGLHARFEPSAISGAYGFGAIQGFVENADLSRHAAFAGWHDRAESDWTGWGATAVLGAGFDFEVTDAFSFGPIAKIDAGISHRPDVTEKSREGAALHVESESYASVRSSLGLRFGLQGRASAYDVSASAAALWNHAWLDRAGEARASFRDWRDVSFSAPDEAPAKNTATFAFSLSASRTNDFSASLSLGAEAGPSHGLWGGAQAIFHF